MSGPRLTVAAAERLFGLSVTGCRLTLKGNTLSQPTDWNHVWLISKSVLEALYFLSGIGVFIAACYGVKQVRLASDQLKIASNQLTIASEQLKTTKEIADANSGANPSNLPPNFASTSLTTLYPLRRRPLRNMWRRMARFWRLFNSQRQPSS
jgi:hypothetical protein